MSPFSQKQLFCEAKVGSNPITTILGKNTAKEPLSKIVTHLGIGQIGIDLPEQIISDNTREKKKTRNR